MHNFPKIILWCEQNNDNLFNFNNNNILLFCKLVIDNYESIEYNLEYIKSIKNKTNMCDYIKCNLRMTSCEFTL